MTDNGKLDLAMELFHSAFTLQQKGLLDDALEQYRESIATYPTAEAHTFAGWVLSMKGQYEEAIAECLTALSIDPGYGNPYNDIGSYLISLKRYPEAREWLERALGAPRYEPRHYPYFNLGRLDELTGNWLGAIRWYEKSLQVLPGYKPARHALLKLTALLN